MSQLKPVKKENLSLKVYNEIRNALINGQYEPGERLVISENTVRTHAKHIYTKLDIHRRQELLDMLHE